MAVSVHPVPVAITPPLSELFHVTALLHLAATAAHLNCKILRLSVELRLSWAQK
jgi:hypothetical protein